MIYLVCFDVTDDKTRNTLVKVLLKYGRRIQYSIFELDLCPIDYKKFEIDLKKVPLNQEEDKCFIYPMNNHCLENSKYLGKYERLLQVYVF